MNSSSDIDNLSYGMIFREFKKKIQRLKLLIIDHVVNCLGSLTSITLLLCG